MKILLTILILTISFNVYAAPPTRANTYTAGTIIEPSDVTDNEDAIFSYLQSGVDTLAADAVNSSNEVAANVIGNSELINTADYTMSGITINGAITDGSGSFGAPGYVLTQAGSLINWSASGLRAEVGTFTRDTDTAGSGTQVIDGLNGTPVGLIFFMAEADADEASFGLDDGTTAKSIYDNNAAAADSWSNSNNSIADIHSAGNTHVGSVSTLASGSFTITWIEAGAPTGTLTIQYMVLY